MAVLISDTEEEVRAFLAEKSSPQDFEAWIISVLDEAGDEREALWELRLLLTEYGEKLRPLDDARNRALQLLSDLELSLTDSGSSAMTVKVGVLETSGASP